MNRRDRATRQLQVDPGIGFTAASPRVESGVGVGPELGRGLRGSRVVGGRERARALPLSALIAAVLCIGTRLHAATPSVPSGTAYETIIAPILRARCVECHGEKKQKAKLALHTWETLTRGSDAGPVFVAGKPDESVLMERLRLPVSDEEHMPPEDRPQPAPEEIDLLARWIEHGASRSAAMFDLKLPPKLAAVASALPAKLAALERAHAPAEPRWEFDAAAVAKSRAPLAAKVKELQERFPGALSYESRTSAALHFTAAGFGRDFGDAELAALAPLAGELAWLDLSGTAVTDQSASVLARFSKLVTLRASFTDMADDTAHALTALPNLQSLTLAGTKLTAASVDAFAKMRALQSLRLSGTAAEGPAHAAKLPVALSTATAVVEVPARADAP